MVKSDDIHPYTSDNHRRVSRGILMWTPLVCELLLLVLGFFMLSAPRAEKWLVVAGLVVIAIGLVGTIVAMRKRPTLAVEPESAYGDAMFDEGTPRQEHM